MLCLSACRYEAGLHPAKHAQHEAQQQAQQAAKQPAGYPSTSRHAGGGRGRTTVLPDGTAIVRSSSGGESTSGASVDVDAASMGQVRSLSDSFWLLLAPSDSF